MIAFYNGTTNELIGTVKEVDGALVADTDSLKEYESYSPKDFMNRFSDYDNGYEFSLVVPDDQTPEQKLESSNEEPKNWTPEEIKAAQEKKDATE